MANRIREDREDDVDTSGLLFNTLRKRHGLPNDLALANWLDAQPSTVSKIRHGHMDVTSAIILRIHEKDGMPVKAIRQLIAGRPL